MGIRHPRKVDIAIIIFVVIITIIGFSQNCNFSNLSTFFSRYTTFYENNVAMDMRKDKKKQCCQFKVEAVIPKWFLAWMTRLKKTILLTVKQMIKWQLSSVSLGCFERQCRSWGWSSQQGVPERSPWTVGGKVTRITSESIRSGGGWRGDSRRIRSGLKGKSTLI